MGPATDRPKLVGVNRNKILNDALVSEQCSGCLPDQRSRASTQSTRDMSARTYQNFLIHIFPPLMPIYARMDRNLDNLHLALQEKFAALQMRLSAANGDEHEKLFAELMKLTGEAMTLVELKRLINKPDRSISLTVKTDPAK